MKFNFQKAEEIYVPPQPETRLETFIRNNFEIPDNNLNKIVSFINNFDGLEDLIIDLPKIIDSEFPNSKISINFFEDEFETDEELEITIFSLLDGTVSAIKENTIYDILFDKFKLECVDKIFINLVF